MPCLQGLFILFVSLIAFPSLQSPYICFIYGVCKVNPGFSKKYVTN